MATPAEHLSTWFLDNWARLRGSDSPPATREEARRRAREIRKRIREAEQDALPAKKCPLDPQVLGVLERDGYRVERLIFQTRPGCYATSTVYVPTGLKGRIPAVLNVHGHWAGARRDPVVQSRCIGLAKLGFVTLTLDAWGAGERGTQQGRNEYHGGLLGASLWPVGTPLHGLQLWDNIRALDYLQTRPEVEGKRLGCTGASGGGNQTTYLSAFDERVRCAVPVCSVGTYRDYLKIACCVDEVLLGGLTFAEEGDLLGIVAPRPLMVITASRDAYHFGPVSSGEAVDRARGYFRAHSAEDHLRQVIFESGHDYNRPMREAMYGWMTRWLKEEGDGSPIPEPAFRTDDPEALRCFAPESRPAKIMTTVRWVQEHAARLAGAPKLPSRPSAWDGERRRRKEALAEVLWPRSPHVRSTPALDGLTLIPEPGVRIPLALLPYGGQRAGPETAAILLHPRGRRAALETALARTLSLGGVLVYAPELRGCDELTLAGQALGNDIPDHNIVEWSLWIGRPLLGQWVRDALDLRGALSRQGVERFVVAGWREGGLAAILAAALDDEIRGVAALEPPATFVSDVAPHQVRMVAFQPDLLTIGDVPHLAALSAPRPVLLADPVRLDGMSVPRSELDALYAWPRSVYEKLGRGDRFNARAGAEDAELAEMVRSWLR